MEIPSKTTDKYWISVFSESYLLSLSNQKSTDKKRYQSGKWLIFEHISEIDATWAKVKNATIKGLLGNYAKVSTAKQNPNRSEDEVKVICVYTYDFNDQEDVMRIANQIRILDIPNKLSYKLDKDVGKYSKDGFKDLSQQTLFSETYFKEKKRFIEGKYAPSIQFLRKNATQQETFQLSKLDVEKDQFISKIIYLKKLGFHINKEQSIHNNAIQFTCID